MANNSKKSTKKSATSDDNVVRIKAGASSKKSSEPKAAKAAPASVKVKDEKPAKTKKKQGNRLTGMFRSIGEYFTGAWYELRLVRWPNRSATWSLTLAVLLYSAFFVILVLLLDVAFKYLFELLLT